ncbi:unnamed protein product [Auanema sp. JU1783]|nr:unnamed protein product [Auanema sp. JU1783]
MTLDTTPKKLTDFRSISYNRFHRGNNVRITVAANQGGRKYMEDRVQIETFRNNDGAVLFTFLGVYDGHGGCEASEFVRKNLMNSIVNQEVFFSDDDDDILEAIRLGFLETHEQMWKVVDTWPRTASGYSSTAGTTASVAIIRGGKLYTGHVGDSAIVLGKKDSKTMTVVPERLTIDHKPESEDEQTRIQIAGGQVMMKSGVNRVVWTRPLRGHTGPVRRSTPTENIPFLAVARSLGDLWSYCESTKQFIVSPDPDLNVRTLTDDDCFVVLASDGLTNVISAQDVTYIVDEDEELTKKSFAGRRTDYIERDKHTNNARSLLFAALKNWRTFRADNISAIVAVFDPVVAVNQDDDVASVEEVLPMNRSIDEVFCVDPEAMIRVSPYCTQKIATYRTPLVYQGALDNNFSSVNYRGPGFLTHDEEKNLEERYHDAENESELTNKDSAEDIIEEKESIEAEDEEETNSIQVTPENKGEVSPSVRSRSAKRSAPINLFNRDKLRNSGKRVKSALNLAASNEESVNETGKYTDEENISETNNSSTPEKRVTRSSGLTSSNKKMSNRKSRDRNEEFDSSTILEFSVSESSFTMTTRSKDKMNAKTSPNTSPKTPVPCKSPNKILTSAKSSRKRPHTSTIVSCGATPLVNRLTIDTSIVQDSEPKMRSAPTSPAKKSVPTGLLGSKWSLSKLDEMKSTIREEEPPSKIRRIYGFMRKLVGFATSQS